MSVLISIIITVLGTFLGYYLTKNKRCAVVVCIVLFVGVFLFDCLILQEGGEGPQPTPTVTSFPTDEPADAEETPSPTNNNEEISLLDLEPYAYEPSADYYPLSDEYNVQDVFGNEYSEVYRAYMEREAGKFSMTFRLNNEFRKLKGIVTVSKKSRGSNYKGSFYLYVDGKREISMKSIASDSDPKPIEVDLTGVTDLKIEMYGNGNMGNDGIDVMLAEPILIK